MNRRSLLATIVGAGAVPTVGCLGDGDPTDEVTAEEIAVEYEVVDGAPGLHSPDVDSDQLPMAVHVTSQSAAEAAFGLEPAESRTEATPSFVEATSFDEELLLYVRSRGSNTCYALRIESLDMTPERVLTGSASAYDSSSENEACGDAVISVSQLVRVHTEPALPSHAEITVSGGIRNRETVTSRAPE